MPEQNTEGQVRVAKKSGGKSGAQKVGINVEKPEEFLKGSLFLFPSISQKIFY